MEESTERHRKSSSKQPIVLDQNTNIDSIMMDDSIMMEEQESTKQHRTNSSTAYQNTNQLARLFK